VRFAFKEWAIVVDALGAGEQIIILRKGGIHEGKSGFAIEHKNFLLFPTRFHQQRESVVERSQLRFDQIWPHHQDATRTRLEFIAEVVEWSLLDSLSAAGRLQGQHIWREDVIRKRFDWGGSKSVYALAVRVSRLPVPVVLPMLQSYGGCKSWIDLEQEVETAETIPVLDEEHFSEKLRSFQSVRFVSS